MSTLHALRDTTLTHTHSLLAYLLRTHSIPASYRLLARSSTSQSSGWGCIRLAPSAITSPASPKSELRPQVRRSSDVTEKYKKPPIVVPTFSLDEAIADEDESDEDDDDEAEQGKGKVALRPGYNGNNGNNGGSQNEDEVEEETADSQVAKEVERRDAKEG